MTGLTIYPTHTCFDDALEYIAEIVKRNVFLIDSDQHFLVHGILLSPDFGAYSHAWVEEGDFVWFGGIIEGQKGYCQVARNEFYEEMQVQEVTKYSIRKARRENLRTGHYGPWLDKYRQLTRDYKATEP